MAASESCGRDGLASFLEGHLSLKDFEWEPRFRPSASLSSSPTSLAAQATIPVIDLQPLFNDHGHPLPPNSDGYDNLVADLSHAASTVGFFQVFNHHISLSALEALSSYGRRFFSLPLERKYEVDKLLQVHPSGYVCGNPAQSPNKWWSEYLRLVSTNEEAVQTVARCLGLHEAQEQQAFSDVLKECSTGFVKLAQELTLLLLQGLGLKGKEVLENYVEEGDTACLKLCHYPPCPQPDLTLGVPPHSDVSIVSLLWQDHVGGLQLRNMDGEWITVKPRHDALVVNVGDIFQIWSNDRYRSALHRVVLNTRECRYSTIFLYFSGADPVIAPIQELLKKTNEAPKFRSTHLSKHRTSVRTEITFNQGTDYLRC